MSFIKCIQRNDLSMIYYGIFQQNVNFQSKLRCFSSYSTRDYNRSRVNRSQHHSNSRRDHHFGSTTSVAIERSIPVRSFSSSNKTKNIEARFNNCVLISRSNDIFENLAIEDWLYRYQNFDDNNELLLIWSDRPSVVIGRHQNPWQEVNLDQCIRSNVSVARRNSGGGTVYYDEQNLNICFFTSKKAYNRRRNLELIRDTIKTKFDIDLHINCKEDLVFDRTLEKVSGTASKLAYNKSYHHCTLLINSNLNDLSKFIRKKSNFIISNATKSVYSPVKNLSAINPNIKIDNFIDALIDKYRLNKQISEVRYVDFDENTFPTIGELRSSIENWEWVFGRSPKFRLINTDTVNGVLYKCEMEIVKGCINSLNLFKQNEPLSDDNVILETLKGKKLIHEICKSELDIWLTTRNDFESIYRCKLVLDTINAIR